jgi:hypothetical protein
MIRGVPLGERINSYTCDESLLIPLILKEISTVIRYGYKPVIFILNNGGYTVEVGGIHISVETAYCLPRM